MSKPDKYPDWALVDFIDPISKSNNVIEPPEEYKQRGFNYQDKAPRNWVNYQFRFYGRWIRYFDGQIGGGVGTTQLKANSYTLSTLPSASTAGAGAIIYVSNATGGGVPCFSDGTNWLRTTDRTQVD